MNIQIIENLYGLDPTHPSYRAYKSSLGPLLPVSCMESQDVLQQLRLMSRLESDVHIILLSHGSPAGIATRDRVIPWDDILGAVAPGRNGQKRILNLMGVCHSSSIEGTFHATDHGVDEVWAVKGETETVHKPLMAARSPSFDDFMAMMGDEDTPYVRISK